MCPNRTSKQDTVPLRAVITRPSDRQHDLAQALSEQGWDVLSLPALALRELADDDVQRSNPRAHDWVMFVSRSAWQIYRARLPCEWPSETGIATVGQGTAAIIEADLRTQTERPTVLSPEPLASQDSEGLWLSLKDRLSSNSRVLIVAGRDGRTWLADQLRAHGVHTEVLWVYERCAAPLTCDAIQKLQAWTEASRHSTSGVWLFTSQHSIDAMAASLSAVGLLETMRPAAWILTHPRLQVPLQKLALRTLEGLNAPVLLCSPDDAGIQAAFAQMAQRFQSC